ncbi:MAG: hypothetical protein KJ900_10720 [Proteobacteria bacterium]|nr:hypothetical protein [Desulfocapsa sp.]MBU3946380.1 hypothetical protein [Pseudomonadota bacterium]MCG2744894.1 hypothetical protein [Desulfobacteraceae bacterium]MBU3984100.1 hypothetical protein [Pseudomonadota bacterium]MBU4030203.1 hypothetical protein [Pseudomonadota bacterium]
MIVSTSNASSDQEVNLLIDLANKQIGQLSKTEELFIKLAIKFNVVDLSVPDISNNNPWNSEKWAKERTIRAEVIEWFFFNEQAKKQVGLKGIHFNGFKIQGNINLDNCTISFPFKFELCAIPDGIILTNSNLNTVTIKSSTIGSITAYLSTIKIVYLEHLEIFGKIDFSSSLIMKGLSFDKINITNKNSTTVALNDTVVGGVLEFVSFKSDGGVTALSIEVGSILKIHDSQIFNPTGAALSLDGATIKGSAFLDQSYHAVGETRFIDATLQNLYMDGALMENPRGQTLVADGIVIKEDLRLSNTFKSIGKISLQNAKIGGSIYFSAGQLINPSGDALQASGSRIGRSVYFDENFISKGAIWFVGSHINSDLVFQNATFNNPNLLVITLSQTEIRSICFDNNFKAVGLIDISGARITNILQIYDGADLSESILNLRNTRVKTLNDRKESWPANGNLFINGFIYEEIFDKSPLEVNERIKWIELQPQDGFKPQPKVDP